MEVLNCWVMPSNKSHKHSTHFPREIDWWKTFFGGYTWHFLMHPFFQYCNLKIQMAIHAHFFPCSSPMFQNPQSKKTIHSNHPLRLQAIATHEWNIHLTNQYCRQPKGYRLSTVQKSQLNILCSDLFIQFSTMSHNGITSQRTVVVDKFNSST